MYTFINFPNLMQKTGKNYRIQRQREGGRGERWGGASRKEREREGGRLKEQLLKVLAP